MFSRREHNLPIPLDLLDIACIFPVDPHSRVSFFLIVSREAHFTHFRALLSVRVGVSYKQENQHEKSEEPRRSACEHYFFPPVIIKPWCVVSGMIFHAPAQANTETHRQFCTLGRATFR